MNRTRIQVGVVEFPTFSKKLLIFLLIKSWGGVGLLGMGGETVFKPLLVSYPELREGAHCLEACCLKTHMKLCGSMAGRYPALSDCVLKCLVS